MKTWQPIQNCNKNGKVYVIRSLEKGVHLTNYPELFTVIWCRELDPLRSPIDRDKIANNEPLINEL